MSAEKNKALSNAQKLAQRGLFDKAIKAYRQIAESDPSDVRIWLKIGDLYSRKGDVSSAVSNYTRVAKVYEERGFFLKAVAVYKQILDVDPTLVEIHQGLGEVYIKLNLMAEALSQFQLVVGSLERDGRHPEALELLRRMVDLVPENETNHLRLAEALARDCEDEEAKAEFRLVLERMKRADRRADYIKVGERLLYLYPEEDDNALQLSEMYLEEGEVARALHWLQILFKRDNTNTITLELLARAFLAINKSDRTIAVYRELARLYGLAGNDARRVRSYEKILALSPNDAEAIAVLGERSQALDQGQSVVAQSSIMGTDLGLDLNLSTEERLAVCLSDVELLLKYELIDHARQRLDIVFGMNPDSITGLELAKRIARDAGETEDAVRALARLAELTLATDPDACRAHLTEAIALDPNRQDLRTMLAGVDTGVTNTAAAPAAPVAPMPSPSKASMSMDETGEFDLSLDLELGDLDLDEFGDLSGDASEFELSLDGFEMDDLSFEVDDIELTDGRDDEDEFADLLATDSPAEPMAQAPAPSDAIVLAPPSAVDETDRLSTQITSAPSLTGDSLSHLEDNTTESAPLLVDDLDEIDLEKAALDALSSVGDDDDDDFGDLLLDDDFLNESD